MKATGIVRQLDGLGRIVIPMELRRTLGIDEKDPLEIFVDGQCIVLQKYSPGCVFCEDSSEEMTHLFGKLVCGKCAAKIRQLELKVVGHA